MTVKPDKNHEQMPDYGFQINKQFQEIMKQNAEYMAKVYEPLFKLQNLPALQELQETVRKFSKLADEIAFENQETVRRLAEVNTHPGLKAFTEQMQLLSEQFTTKFNFDHVFTPRLSQLIATIDWDSIPDDVLTVELDRLNKTEIYDEIERKFHEEKTGYSGKQFLYLTIITIILQIVGNYYAHQAHVSDTDKQIPIEQEQSNVHLKNIEGFLAKAVSTDEASKTNPNMFLEVKKEASLRIYPDSSSDSILTVFPGQFLDLLDDTKRWYKVQFVNFENGDFGTGWIFKGHVEEIHGEE